MCARGLAEQKQAGVVIYYYPLSRFKIKKSGNILHWLHKEGGQCNRSCSCYILSFSSQVWPNPSLNFPIMSALIYISLSLNRESRQTEIERYVRQIH